MAMKSRNLKIRATHGAVLLLATCLLSACGVRGGRSALSSSYNPSSLVINQNGVYPSPTGTAGTTGTSGTTGTTAPTGHTNPGTGLPPITLDVRGAGYTTYTFTVRARSVLKVKFTPGTQDTTISGTGYSPQYSGLGVYIAAGSSTQMTPLLYNGLYGGQAQSSTFDFSSALNTACSSSDTACRDSVTITVSHPNYDYDCLNFGTGCSWTRVRDGHPWHGTMLVQTDDAGSL